MMKKVLNTHIAPDEYAFLKEQARFRGMTITGVLRELIRAEMRRIPPTKTEERTQWAAIRAWQEKWDAEHPREAKAEGRGTDAE